MVFPLHYIGEVKVMPRFKEIEKQAEPLDVKSSHVAKGCACWVEGISGWEAINHERRASFDPGPWQERPTRGMGRPEAIRVLGKILFLKNFF